MNRRKLKQLIMCRDLGHCRYPGCHATEELQMAHRIADTEDNKKEIRSLVLGTWGQEVSLSWVKENMIDHPFNVCISCPKHNDYFNIGFKPEVKAEVIFAIMEDIMNGGGNDLQTQNEG